MTQHQNILFMCVANSARSQIAHGIAADLAPAGVNVYSAGSEPSHVRPQAIAALAEIGIDISHHTSKGLDAIPIDRVDTLITLCAEEVCPHFPHTVEHLHWPLPDPAGHTHETEAEQLDRFRQTRDAIALKLKAFFT